MEYILQGNNIQVCIPCSLQVFSNVLGFPESCVCLGSLVLGNSVAVIDKEVGCCVWSGGFLPDLV